MLSNILNTWYGKALLSIIMALFSPFKIVLAVLLTLIIIDTITGSIYSISINKFSSTGLRKGLKKIFMYFICILVVRLTEIGIDPVFETIYLTNSCISFLVLIESISALENLTLLGVPLPMNVKDFILNQIKIKELKELLKQGTSKKEYIQEVLDMIDCHFPAISDCKLKQLLDIQFKEWAQFINIIDAEFSKNNTENYDLLYYRTLSLAKATVTRIKDKWIQEEIPKDCIDDFRLWSEPRIGVCLTNIKEICYNNEPIDKKKIQIIEKIILFLYQTLTDVQKLELCKERCTNNNLN